jgi:hypothetical protein
VSAQRSYDGPPLDATYQYITERPSLDEQAEETLYATDPEPVGEERTENVPTPESDPDRPDVEGQSTWADWGGDQA